MSHFLVLLLISTTLSAKDFGTVSNSFPIDEQNIIEYMKERLSSLSLEDQKKITALTKQQIDAIKQPLPLNFPNALTYKSYLYDPTITANEDIKDSEGAIIISKGTCYNPLEHCTMNGDLLFFDATQKDQLEWAKCTPGMWILTKGRPIELEEEMDFPVYFDQQGSISKKLGIQAIPAKISQEGKLLRIEEIRLGEKQ